VQEYLTGTLAAGVGARLNQRSEPDRGVERALLPRRGDEAVGVPLQHQAFAHARLAPPRHGGDIGRLARVTLLDRWARVAARLALPLCPGERDEAARVPRLFALSEADLAEGPAVLGTQRHRDVWVAQTGNGVAIGVDLGHA
jgi:hypothetical protein